MKKKLFTFLFYSYLLFSYQEIQAKTLHAIIVTDTIHDIAFASIPDLKQIQRELRSVSKSTHMVLQEKTFSGSDFQKHQVKSYLNQLSLGSKDAVVFYFSGHGYRTREKSYPWPTLNFEFYKPGIDLKWVADTIRNKKPQFALIMADCCNNYTEQGFNNETKQIRISLPLQSPKHEGYDQLFNKAKGCIVVCSSSPGQFSYGSRFGGLFTQCFMASLKQETNEAVPSWKRLLERAFSYIKNIQKPVCEVFQ